VTGEDEVGGGAADPEAEVDEQFLHTVVSENVLAGWEELQSMHARFLGGDLPEAWLLVEVTHQPTQKVDAEGKPTGEWELISSGKWKRDPSAPTPAKPLQIAEELPELSELEAS
jgi:hypothetical protein